MLTALVIATAMQILPDVPRFPKRIPPEQYPIPSQPYEPCNEGRYIEALLAFESKRRSETRLPGPPLRSRFTGRLGGGRHQFRWSPRRG